MAALLISPTGVLIDKTLTIREQQILKLIAEGHSTKIVAEKLGISRETIRKHLQHIYRKLEVHNKVGALRRSELF